MTHVIESTIGVTEVHANPSAALQRAAAGERITVLKHNRPIATIVDPATAARMKKIDELEDDMRLLALGVLRLATDNGVRHRLEDVAAELGIDLDDE
jgi:antitoxin (DNA-binding transcriptional repressor) of toxin-antitoxin stability system